MWGLMLNHTIAYSKFWVRNFKSIEYLEFPLGKLNVLVGPNGAGKTNIVEAFIMAKLVARPQTYPSYSFAPWWGYKNVVFMNDTSRNMEFGVEGAVDGEYFKYSFIINGANGLMFLREELQVKEDHIVRVGRDLEINGSRVRNALMGDDVSILNALPMLLPLMQVSGEVSVANLPIIIALSTMLLNDIVILRVIPESASSPVPVVEPPVMRIDGYGLVRLLHQLVNQGLVSDDLKGFLEEYGYTLSFELSPDGRLIMNMREVIDGNPLLLNPSMMPHGVVKAITILAVLSARPPVMAKPPLLVIDEFENSLHLRLVEKLLDAIRHSDAKAILTTHSPMVIDLVDPGDLVLVAKESGRTKITRISNPEEVKRWLSEKGITLSEGVLYGEIYKNMPTH